MLKRPITLFVAFACVLTAACVSASNILEQFNVTLESADVYKYTASSLTLESTSPSYMMKLEPNLEGTVMFSLRRLGYSTTLKVKNLVFGAKVEGFRAGELVSPMFQVDDGFQNVVIDGNFVVFGSTYEPIPIYFNTIVDSVKIHFSNSYGLSVHQFLAVDDLKIVKPASTITNNPLLLDCDKHSIMIGLDGSSSIDNGERKTIAKQLLRFFKKPPESLDSNAICILEFGQQVHAFSEAVDKKNVVKNIKSYKKGTDGQKNKTGYTNWAAAFDRAIERQPDIFIFITDRWSNYADDKASSFNAQYQMLIAKCDELKSKGTRLLFITSGLNMNGDSSPALYSMLNQNNTNEVVGVELTPDMDLKHIDLISMNGFETFERINLSSLLSCGEAEVITDLSSILSK